MGLIDEDKIREIRERTDIVELIGRYLPLKKSGANFQGLCPFHQEKSPSFNVNPPRQIFHCFGCGVGGNVFSFLMRMEGLSFPEAVRRLAEQVGIEIVEEELTPQQRQERDQREVLFRINSVAAEFYRDQLLQAPSGAAGRRYLRQRGYDGDTVRAFDLGFAPDAWSTLTAFLATQGFAAADVQRSGLTRSGRQERGDYDLFRNRLLFPIHDPQGRVVAFGGRVLDASLPKYINSPESPIYHKGQTLYGLYQAKEAMRQAGDVLVVEGYFDVLALHRAGFANCVATCGTALTAEHARLLKRFADRVLLVFDQDAAGRQATFRAMDVLLPGGLDVVTVNMPGGADPDSLILEEGVDRFRDCLQSARPVLDVFLDAQLAGQPASVEGRVRAAEEVLTRIRRLPNELQRDLYRKRLAEATGLDEGLLRSRIGTSAAAERPSRPAAAAARTATARPATPDGVRRSQQFLLQLMLLDDPAIRRQVRQAGTATLFRDADYRALAEYLLDRQDASGTLDIDRLGDRLDETLQPLLAGLLLREDTVAWEGSAERIFVDCRRAVERDLLKSRLHELGQAEQDARQRGDDEALHACLTERLQINSSLKKNP
ncbi:MAG: DNA primase [Desulfuromonadales bacterium]|nr:DNA primase [Desulfuromonadales bacterium]